MVDPIELLKSVIATYANNPKWVGAPLGDIKILSNTHVGSVQSYTTPSRLPSLDLFRNFTRYDSI